MIGAEFSALADRVEIRVGDANDEIRAWCVSKARKERAVVFLDPYGMQVEWTAIKALASTKAVDLWYLFPLSGIIRLLRRDGNLDEKCSRRLDTLFGTPEWRTHFYKPKIEENLFGEYLGIDRNATESNIIDFIEGRLRTLFAGVAKSRVLRNSRQSPLYALCFAASNEKGAKPALKIAQHLLDNWGRGHVNKIDH